jgi:hypothetical protein
MHSRHDPQTTTGHTQQTGDDRQIDQQQCRKGGRHQPEGAGISAMVTGRHMRVKENKNGREMWTF